MNAVDEKTLYKDALESGLLNGNRCYQKVDAAIRNVKAEEAESRLPWKGLLRLAIPAAMLLIAGTAVAAGVLLTGKGSRIRFFSDTDQPAILAQRDYYERHSDAVEDRALDTRGNALLTVENIAIHRERVTVFYRTDGEHRQAALALSVNGGEERTPDSVERMDLGQGESIMASFAVFPEVPRDCSLTVRFYGADGALLAQKEYAVDLAQAQVEDLVILSGKTIRIDGAYSEEPEPPYRPYHDHEVTVDSVRIDRDGGCLTLSETILPQGPYTNEAYAAWAKRRTAAKEAYFSQHPGATDLEWEQYGMPAFLQADPCPLTPDEINALQAAYDGENEVSWDPFVNFAVTDENGVSLMPQLEGYTGGSGQGPAVNEIRFTPRAGMKAIRITPLYYAGQQETVRAMFDPADGADETGKLELVSFTVDRETRTVTVSYRTRGIRILDSYSEFLLDRRGEPVYPEAMYEETHFLDASTGTVTSKIVILDDAWDMDRIGGYGQAWSVPYPDETKTVTICLETEV